MQVQHGTPAGQVGDLAAGPVEDQVVQLADHARALGRGHEHVRRYLAEQRVRPPGQRLDRDHRTGVDAYDRLVVHGEPGPARLGALDLQGRGVAAKIWYQDQMACPQLQPAIATAMSSRQVRSTPERRRPVHQQSPAAASPPASCEPSSTIIDARSPSRPELDSASEVETPAAATARDR